MAIIFSGKDFAEGIEVRIKEKVTGMARKPKLVTFYDPENTGSRIYTQVKEKKAQELGISFEKVQGSKFEVQYREMMEKLNSDDGVDGIMVQVPMEGQNELISLIDPNKDVDGLREDSPYLPATVRAVVKILDLALATSPPTPLQNFGEGNKKGGVLVVGSKGEVGKRLVKELGCAGMDKEDFDLSALLGAEVIISATGQEGLIKPEMVKEGVVCIDVGYPKGDFAPEVAGKSSFFTPVPGGVGPVTVAMLFANLVKLKT